MTNTITMSDTARETFARLGILDVVEDIVRNPPEMVRVCQIRYLDDTQTIVRPLDWAELATNKGEAWGSRQFRHLTANNFAGCTRDSIVGDLLDGEDGCCEDDGFDDGPARYSQQQWFVTTVEDARRIERQTIQQQFEYELGQLNGMPGSFEWFDSMQHRIDNEDQFRSPEMMAERWSAVVFGAQTREGFYSDQDTSASISSRFRRLMEHMARTFPLDYMAWKNRGK